MIALLFLTLFNGDPAAAHAGCGDEPFAQVFADFLAGGFKVRETSAAAPASYFLMPDGTRVTLDPGLEAATRRLAGAMVTAPESKALYATPSWRELFFGGAWSLGAKINHFLSRRFVFELTGITADVLYRFGVAAATFVAVTETIDHGVNPTNIPFCKAIYGTCAFFGTELQEIGHLATKPFPVGSRFDARLSRWLRAKGDRFRLWRASFDLRREGEKENLNVLARNRSRRDLTGGASTFYGGFFSARWLRGALVRPICEDCAPPPGRGLRYKTFGRPVASGIFVPTGAVPGFADLGPDLAVGERVIRTEQYLAFTKAIFAQAELAAGDLALARDGLAWAEWRGAVRASLSFKGGRRPDLKTFGRLLAEPWPAYRRGLGDSVRKLPGYLGLRRDLARMKKSFDLYTYALRMRAYDVAARTADEAAIDRDFAANFSEFLSAYSARIALVETMDYGPVDDVAPLHSVPKRALDNLKRWTKTGVFCDDVLTADAA